MVVAADAVEDGVMGSQSSNRICGTYYPRARSASGGSQSLSSMGSGSGKRRAQGMILCLRMAASTDANSGVLNGKLTGVHETRCPNIMQQSSWQQTAGEESREVQSWHACSMHQDIRPV